MRIAPHTGHILRHSVASRFLRTGAPMKDIADVLRHHSLDTSAIYAKVDLTKLAAVALSPCSPVSLKPW